MSSMRKMQGVTWFLVVCLMVMCFSGISVSAADENVPIQSASEYIQNGGFEAVDANGAPSSWVGGAGYLDDFQVTSEEKAGGGKSLKVSTEKSMVLLSQLMTGLVADTEYKVKFNLKVKDLKGIDNGKGAAVTFAFRNRDKDGTVTPVVGKDFRRDIKNETLDNWQEHSLTFIAPSNEVIFSIRFYGGGEAYFDDVSIQGEAPVKEEDPIVILDPVPGAPDLIQNGTFDTLESWTSYSKPANPPEGTVDDKYVSWVDDGYEGKGIKVFSAEPQLFPWAATAIHGVEEGGEYQVTAYLKTNGVVKGNAAFKIEYYTSDIQNSASYMPLGVTINLPNRTNWTKVAGTFKVPKGAKSVRLFLRLMAAEGELYWDNAECYMTKDVPKFNFETDQFFYYTGTDRGEMTLHKTLDYQVPPGSTADFAIEDADGTVIYSAAGIAINESASCGFDVSLLAQKETAYKATYTCKNAEGTIIAQGHETIYRYDRPTAIGGNGAYMKDGRPFFPVIGYHVEQQAEDFAYCKSAGINVIQFFPGTTEASAILSKLDTMHENGFMALVALYTNMKPAGHPDNAAATKKIVEAVRNHPATFGYMAMDEPMGNNSSIEDLKNSYKIIHELDKVHPIYMVEGGEHTDDYALVGKCADILAVDPYPSGLFDESVYVAEKVEAAKKAVGYDKPVYCINQAYKILSYEPDSVDIVHAAYQAVMAGAEGIGYYDVRDYYKYIDGTEYQHIWDRICWDGVQYVGETREELFDAFVQNKYPLFNDKKDDGLWWKIYIKDNKANVVILNRGAAKDAEIPLESYDGAVKIGDFNAVAYSVGNKPDITGNGTLSVHLEHGECAIYEVIPMNAIDFSPLKPDRFMDLTNYAWARAQINSVDEMEIVNKKGFRTYSPATSITRADFAYFLTRALGISEELDDNQHDPYSEISRRDAVAMVEKALELKNVNFDSSSLSELVTGNEADHITRAVAAVTMYRLVNSENVTNPEPKP